MKKASILTAKVSGTEDKMRIRFCLQRLTSKMQGIIADFFQKKWNKAVMVIRWPRPNVVEIRLSYELIRTAGFLEITQEVSRYWRNFLNLVEKEAKLLQLRAKKLNCKPKTPLQIRGGTFLW